MTVWCPILKRTQDRDFKLMTASLSQLSTRRFSKVPFWGWVLIASLCLVLIVTVMAPQSYPKGSSYDNALNGYAQWYRFMEAQHHPVKRWRRAYSQLAGTGQTFIQAADAEGSESPDIRAPEILDWVKNGNTLIELSWAGKLTGAPFLSDLPTPKGAVRIETTRRYEPNNFDEVLLEDAFGVVIRLETLKAGEAIEIAYPWMGAGNYADRGANFQVLADLATQRKGTIWVDEWIHGYRDKEPTPVLVDDKTQDLWDYFAQRPIVVMAGQGMLLLLLLLWGQNQRFGALFRIVPPLRNSNEQYIQALADTLNTHGHTEYVLTLLGQSLRDRLKSRLSLVGADLAGDADGAIAAQWATVTGRPASELLELLEQSSAQKRLRDSELLAWVQQADTILRGLS
jgi:Domain of unknown function (DUF4350)